MTRILLDTHMLVWALDETSRLPKEVREAIQQPENEVLFSSASIWEIPIKTRLRRAALAERPERIALEAIDVDFTELPIRWRAASAAADLPMHHQDRFDRIVVAQAITEPVHLYTVDRKLAPYSAAAFGPNQSRSNRWSARSTLRTETSTFCPRRNLSLVRKSAGSLDEWMRPSKPG